MSIASDLKIPLDAQADDFAKLFPISVERTFTETAGAGVYTGTVTQPAGSTLEDIYVNGIALWSAATSALLSVGDIATPTGYYNAIDLKAGTDLPAGSAISFALAGGKAGAYIANARVAPRYSATARVLNAILTTVGGAGTTGRTRVTFVFTQATAASVAAAKV